MRKFYLLFAALFAYTVVATAGVKNLFKQDFETVSTPADAGWSSPNLAGGMSIKSTDEGQKHNSHDISPPFCRIVISTAFLRF